MSPGEVFAGIPVTTEFGGTSFTTSALAPTLVPSPMVIGPMILAPAPSRTLLPIGCPTWVRPAVMS